MTNLTDRNRKNAQSSSGPRTSAGKARSSQNSLKTGLYSTTALLPSEDAEEYRTHAESYAAELNPIGVIEADLVKVISDNVWCLRRVRGLVASQSARIQRGFDPNNRFPPSVAEETAQSRTLESFSRHEHRLQNAVAKMLKLFYQQQKQAQLAAAEVEETEVETPIETPAIIDAEPQSGFVPQTHFATSAGASQLPEISPEITPPHVENLEKVAA